VDVFGKQTQAAVSQVHREEEAAAREKISPVVGHKNISLDGLNGVNPIIGPGRLHDGFRYAQPILHATTRHAAKNLRILRTLAQKMRIMATMPQSPARESNKQRKNTLVRSETWCSSAEFLEFALRAELKEIILLV
jgi:hypothetical protein